MKRELRFDKINLDPKTTNNLKLHFQKYLFGMFLMLMSAGVFGQVIPTRTDVSGFPDWNDINITGTTYLQLIGASGSSKTITPIMNLTSYSSVKLDYKARSFGTVTTAQKTITISVSTDGISWSPVASVVPANGTMTIQTQIDLTPFISSNVRIRFEALNSNGSVGAGIDDIEIKGTLPTCTTPTISFASATVTKNVGDANFTNVATSSSTGAITYSSNNSAVASVNTSSGLVTIGTAGNATITATQVATGTHCAATTTYAITVNSTTPVISTTGTLSAFTTVYGSPSASQNFAISGANLTGTFVTATAPAGFEIANSAGGPFGSTATFAVSGGITSGTVYIRLAQTTAVGTYSGSISLADNTSSATTTKSIPASTVSPKALTITGISAVSKIYDGTTTVIISGTESYSGLVNSETYPVSGVVSWAFTSKDFGTGINISRTGVYNTPSSNYSVTQPVLSANISKKVLTIAAPVIASKVYDGLVTTGTITPGTLSGLIGSETLLTTATGTYSDANVGVAKPATVVYSLANGTNGGLAVNYSLVNGTGFGDVTVATPTLTASAIALNVLGVYTLPGANITTNSAGALSYSLTSGGNVTLLATTLTGNTIGSETLTITQAASGNYASGSVNVAVNVSAVPYILDDYRSTSNGTWQSSTVGTATWEQYNGSSWFPSGRPGINSAQLGSKTVYIKNEITLVGNNTAPNVVVLENGKLFTSTVAAMFGNLLVKSGGEFYRQGNSSGVNGNFEVEDGGTVFYYHSNTNSRNSSIWAGTEKFYPNSNFIVKETDAGAGFLISENIDFITPFNGALFGNFIIDMDAGKLPLFPATFNATLTAGELVFRKGSDNSKLFDGSYTATIKGNLIIESTYNQRVTLLSGAGTSVLNVNGNITHAGSQALNLNTSTGNSTINLKGDIFISGSGLIEATSTSSSFNFVGNGDGLSAATTQTIDIATTATNENRNILFNIKPGAYIQLINRDFELGKDSKLTVENGGTLDFGFNGTTALNVGISGSQTGTAFESKTGSTLKITSPNGITTLANLGNVQVTPSNRIYNQTANFYYLGKENQVTGNALTNGSTQKNVFVNLLDNTKELRLTNKIGITTPGKLEIQKGTLIGEEIGVDDKDFYGTGNLIMTDGEYRISTITASPTTEFLPQLSSYATYSLTGGTVHLNGSNANQILSGIPIYKNLTFSGSNVLGNDDKKISKAIEITDKLHIKETAILNSENKGVTGNANVLMDGGRWRISKLTNAQPELLGTYGLTGGTIEFYGTGASTNQKIKGGISYFNIDVNADFANTNYASTEEFYNVSQSSSFVVSGNLNVNSPAIFKISSTHSISGTGNVSVNPGSGLLYGSEFGIKTIGVATTDGAIRVSGTRIFSNQASYGFIGGQSTMVTGNGIPASVENLYVVKTNNSDEVLLSNPSLTVKNRLFFINGNINTGSNVLELGTDTANKGTLEYASGYVKGNFKRWFLGTNSGNATGLFPMANATNKNRFAKIEYTTAPATGGTVTASLQSVSMGTAGVSAIPLIPGVGSCASFSLSGTDETGFWTLTNDSALTGGNFTASFTKEDDSNTIQICEMSLLKRDATDWIASGTHLESIGTSTMATLSRSGLNSYKDFGFGFKKCKINTWNGTVWSEGTPNSTHSIILNNDFTSSATLSACECQISTGTTMTILPGHTLELQNGLNNNGTLIIENNASLVQHDDTAVNNGKIIMKRNAQPMYRYDFTYWSSPLTQASGYKLADSNLTTPSLSPETLWDKYFFWNNATQAWNTIPNGNEIMVPGKGYIVRAPQSYSTNPASTSVFEAIFEGFPVNGIVTAAIATTANNYNLIGNPYPSAISADLFLSNPLNENVVDGTVYLWTHNSPPNTATPGNNTYNYTSSDYASYNFTGGTATAGNASSEPDLITNTPTGFIAAGQSFFIKSKSGGNVTFNNSMRSINNNNQFFRMANAPQSTQNSLEKHRIWLNMTNSQGAFNQTLVGYIENASNEWDRGFDGDLMGGNYVTLYSIVANKNLAIQGRALPFNVSDNVDLGYKATIAGNFKISIDHFDGLFENQNIYLEDKTLNIIHDLKQSDYQFQSAIGTFDNRFVLRYTNESLGTGDFETASNDLIISVKSKVITAISSKENIKTITVFDLLGRLIYENKAVNSAQFSIHEITANQQALIVKVQLKNGQKVNKKIIYN